MAILKNARGKYLKGIEQILPRTYPDRDPPINWEAMLLKKQVDFLACYDFRQTLTRLDLYCYGSYSVEGFSGSNVSVLTHFKRLTHLVISNSGDSDLTIFHVLDACQNLSSLEFVSLVAVPDHAKALLKDMIVVNGKEAASSTWPTLTHSQHMKTLSVIVSSLTAPYLKYITSCTSASLNDMTVSLSDASILDSIEEHGLDTATRLFDRLSTIKKVRVIAFDDYENREEVLPIFNSFGQMDQFHMLLNALIVNRDSLYFKADYHFHHVEILAEGEGDPHSDNKESEYIEIDIGDNNCMSIEYFLSFEPLPRINTDNATTTTAGLEIINSLRVLQNIMAH